ncbi:hypothetical protein CEUSTIGMA_g9409.t1 [Chlamydomonas eustigma]|uniref:Uncharacterized protein n=1 Tax=Chlamydomonas eustigma TaxID=1157962 RepID=A0A250XFY2_9CHLO|nr:hypothetical protein CEUSTIGMA_g9409.t1 [Chlamydomonas eustigma]|eukprot:GAX81981.1 hypothetical protein CEUSTIGMA_g9409.t1 [Chlamydomonas eustigma]
MSLMREAQSTTGLPVMQSKRGMAKSELRISEDWNKAGADYWPSDTMMLSAIDGEFEEIKQILSLPLCSEQSMDVLDVHNLWTHEWVLPGGKGARVRGSKKARHGTSMDPQTMCLGMTKEDEPPFLRQSIPDDIPYSDTHEEDFENLPPEAGMNGSIIDFLAGDEVD